MKIHSDVGEICERSYAAVTHCYLAFDSGIDFVQNVLCNLLLIQVDNEDGNRKKQDGGEKQYKQRPFPEFLGRK